MPVPTHFKFTFRGVFLNTPETWSFGVKFERTVGAGGDATVEDVNEGTVTDAISGLINGFNGPTMMNNVRVQDWRCYVIGTDGRAEGDIKVVDVYDANIHGLGSTRQPSQLAVAVTTVGDDRGPGRLGRFYLPGLVLEMGADLRMGVPDAAMIATNVTAFLKKISDAIDLPGVTFSSGAVNISTRGSTAGTKQQVDHVEVGRVVDTLRSRRRALEEERVVGGQIDW